jgi:phage-related protein
MGNMILTDLNGTAYNFNGSFDIKSGKISVNSSIKKLLYAHGGREVGDQYLQARNVIIEGTLYSDTTANFETAKRNFIAAILKGGYLSISNDYVTTRRIAVKLIDYDFDVQDFQLLEKVSITFIAEYPFWEDTSETTSTNIMTGDGNFTITITGSDDIMLPEIEIDADRSVDVPGIRMYNADDGGLVFEYNNPSFFAGDVLQINSKLGTVLQNGNDSKLYFVTPYFMRLQPGANTIYYQGAACTIKIKYRKVYI